MLILFSGAVTNPPKLVYFWIGTGSVTELLSRMHRTSAITVLMCNFIYDFANDIEVNRQDQYGNNISRSSIATWQWGEDAVASNTVIGIQGGVNIINQRGNMNGNFFETSKISNFTNNADYDQNNSTSSSQFEFWNEQMNIRFSYL